MRIDKSMLEKHAKRCDFSAKYISLPCLIVSFICMLAGVVMGNKPLFFMNLFMTVFNFLVHWLNISTRDRMLFLRDALDEHERLQRVRNLNPNKR